MKYWKASELRSFLLYYSLPALYGLLPDEYYEHYFCFVRAIFLLLQDSISELHLTTADQLLDRFCSKFSYFCQKRFEALNVHQLLHLMDSVRDLGALYTHTCFLFEDKNWFILKLVHGTQFIDCQILAAVSFTQKLPKLREMCISPASEEENLYCSLLYSNRPKREIQILPQTYSR